MNILGTEMVPRRILEIANRLNQECKKKVQNLIFGVAGKAVPEGALGSYVPQLDTVFIYVDKCLTSCQWCHVGLNLIAATWMNLLFAVIHEFSHVWQAEDEPWLVTKYKTLPLDYELEANAITMDIIDEFSDWLTPPKIEDMGWMGQEMVKLLNQLFASHPKDVAELINLNGSSVAGEAEMIATLSGKYEDEGAKERLLQLIDEGRLGKRIGNKRFLTFQETVGLFNSNHVEG